MMTETRRKKFSPEEKVGIVVEGLRGGTAPEATQRPAAAHDAFDVRRFAEQLPPLAARAILCQGVAGRAAPSVPTR